MTNKNCEIEIPTRRNMTLWRPRNRNIRRCSPQISIFRFQSTTSTPRKCHFSTTKAPLLSTESATLTPRKCHFSPPDSPFLGQKRCTLTTCKSPSCYTPAHYRRTQNKSKRTHKNSFAQKFASFERLRHANIVIHATCQVPQHQPHTTPKLVPLAAHSVPCQADGVLSLSAHRPYP